MKYGKRLILAAVMSVNIYGIVLCAGTVKYYAAMDDETYNASVSFYNDFYSVFFLGSCRSPDMKETLDYSFDSDRLKAGRLDLSGVWLEITNPFGYSAGSEVYAEQDGADCDFSTDKGGSYGLYADLPFGVDILFMNRRGLWAGAAERVILNEVFSVCAYIKISDKEERSEDDWIITDGFIPVSAPVYAGAEIAAVKDSFSSGLLLFISGGRYVVPGYFARFHVHLDSEHFTADQLFVYSDGRYVPGGNIFERNRIEVSSRVMWVPSGIFSFTAASGYLEKYPGAFPSVYIEKKLDFSLSSRITAGSFVFTAKGARSVNFEESGIREEPYTAEGSAGAVHDGLSVKIYAGERGYGRHSSSRHLGLKAGYTGGGILFSADLRLDSDYTSPDCVFGRISNRLEIKIPSGRVFASASFSSVLSPGGTDTPGLDNLKLGWFSEFDLQPPDP